MKGLGAPFTEQGTRRQANLVTPQVFDVLLGVAASTVYTGRERQSFLIRHMAFVNDTVGAINGQVLVNGNQWYAGLIAAQGTTRVSGLEGMLIDPEIDITASGQNLRLIGWGLRVEGGDAWVL